MTFRISEAEVLISDWKTDSSKNVKILNSMAENSERDTSVYKFTPVYWSDEDPPNEIMRSIKGSSEGKLNKKETTDRFHSILEGKMELDKDFLLGQEENFLNIHPFPEVGHSNRRRLLPHTGVMRTLVLRVTDNQGDSPDNNAFKISDLLFGTHGLTLTGNLNSLASMYDKCSGGKLTFIPTTGTNVIDGILEISVDKNMTKAGIVTAAHWTIDTFTALNVELQIEYEVYSIILPSTVPGGGGLARQGGNYQMYASGAENSLELLVHEFGHNLGFHHSGVPGGSTYGDGSCMMGCCRWAQQMCFNAAKSWYTGWYSEPGKEGYEDLSFFSTPGELWIGKLVGIDDYLYGIFDENQHRVVTKIGESLYMMYNRKKGVNNDVKEYDDTVVIIQQWEESGRSQVLASLDETNSIYTYPNYIGDSYDLVVKVCDIVNPPIIKGTQITGGVASQSSTSGGAVAERAIDGNKDQTFAGGSVTHTEKEQDPWWKWTLDQPEEVGSVTIYNRGDCCGQRLNSARVELYNIDGTLLVSKRVGSSINIKDIYFDEVYSTVKSVMIRLEANEVLSLAEVELFGAPTRPTIPDYADVIAYVSFRDDDDNNMDDHSCDSTYSPSGSFLPTSIPTVTHQPSIYFAIPEDVVLQRDENLCTFEAGNPSRPDRFRCTIHPTTKTGLPGGYGNDPVLIAGVDNCVIEIRPIHWAYNQEGFYFESTEDLTSINACFEIGTVLTDHKPGPSPMISNQPTVDRSTFPSPVPSFVPSITSSVMPSITSSSTPSIISSAIPSAATNLPVAPSAFPSSLISPTITPSITFSITPSISRSVVPTVTSSSNPSSEMITSNPPSASPTKNTNGGIPSDVLLQRNGNPCVLQPGNNSSPDRIKCTIEPTANNPFPGGYDNSPVLITGHKDCIIKIQPVHWAHNRIGFYFQSTESIESINACFLPGVLLEEFVTSIPVDVQLQRNDDLCTFERGNGAYDRFKCTIKPTIKYNLPGSSGNNPVILSGNNDNDGLCLIEIQPVHWAYNQGGFYFESAESLTRINDCFTPQTHLIEFTGKILNEVVLQRDNNPCSFERGTSSRPDRFKCTIEPTMSLKSPRGYGNDSVYISGMMDLCVIEIQPIHWAYNKRGFYFEAPSENLMSINACFAPNTRLEEVKPRIPSNVELRRNKRPCIFEANGSNPRFKCPIRATTNNKLPANYGNNPVILSDNDDDSFCLIEIQPVHWSYNQKHFYFQSAESLTSINSCFAPKTHLTEFMGNLLNYIVLQRDDNPCIFEPGSSSRPDRFKCPIEPTTIALKSPGGYGNDPVKLIGKDGLCSIVIQPVHWAYNKQDLYFEASSDNYDLASINACFTPNTVLSVDLIQF
eukprot:CAMPEP_0194158756 /NCGR_PEP_ID=MMETSP0152-20130528/77447_1 /TAXON_ID=1049557 /ORGANISM="Thalassiothrix antarctica, Strain L6-D1" /LENGTH=1354 /DNA_ID=CAMNT_0038868245 /DNA_START=102 /DNA_END=4166 /DNA_ORIENTATION=+